ncbi:hypothetical protein C8J56DRAFT_894566 [Mycena floridula]|nr:hypothetical protein C8J56DRAFT_894566 [Mycena floridula]
MALGKEDKCTPKSRHTIFFPGRFTMPNVHWVYTAEEYASLNTVDSRTTTPVPIPLKELEPEQENLHTISVHQVAPLSNLPPTPRIPYLSLPPETPIPTTTTQSPPPPTILMNSALTFGDPACLELDISFPSRYFRSNPQLIQLGSLFHAPASNPALSSIHIIAETDNSIFSIIVEPREGDGQLYPSPDGPYVTVGRILGDVNAYFRSPFEGDVTRDIQWYSERRVSTVNGADRPGRARRQSEDMRIRQGAINEEGGKGYRKVDALKGFTKFRGFSLAGEIHEWKLHLDVPERYARA